MNRRAAPLLAVALFLAIGCDDGAEGGAPTTVQQPRDMGTIKVPPRPDASDPDPADAGPADEDADPSDPDGAVGPVADGAVAQGCAEAATRPCPDGCGQQTCDDGAWGACDGEAAIERCNGADDDCDGRIDESFNELGVGCTVQDGACSSQGVHVCAADGNGVVCQAPPVAPQAEVCDGLDNDCDDTVDEGFDGQLCCTENIHCPPGVACTAGMCEGGGPGPGPNPGQQCRNPTELANFGAYAGDLARGAAEHFSLRCDGLFGQELVYSFQLDEATRVRLDTRGSLADTILYVRTNCADDATEVICNDDDPNAGFLEAHSVVEFNAAAGTRYYVFVDSLGFNFLGTGVVLNFNSIGDPPNPPNPPNPMDCQDEFDCALDEVCEAGACVRAPARPECVASEDCPGDQVCEAERCVLPPPPPAAPLCDVAEPLDAFGTYRTSTVGRPDQTGNSCQADSSGGEQAFVFQHDQLMAVLFDTSESDFDTVLSVRTQCDDPESEIQCDDDGGSGSRSALTFVAQPNVPYTVVVDGFRGATGNVELLYDGIPLDFCVDGLCFAQPAMNCAEAEPMGMDHRVEGSTVGAVNRINPPRRCGVSASPDALYAFAFDEDTDVVVSTAGSNYDTVLYVLNRECGPIVECNDDSGGVTSEVRFRATARTLYIAVIDGFEDASGDFVLTVTPQ